MIHKLKHPTLIMQDDFTHFVEFIPADNLYRNNEKELSRLSKEYEIGFFKSGITYVLDDKEISTNFLLICKKTRNPFKRLYRRVEAVLNIFKLKYIDITTLKMDFNPFSFYECDNTDCLNHIYNELYSCDLDGYLLFQNHIGLLSLEKYNYNNFLFRNNYKEFFIDPHKEKTSAKYVLANMDISTYFLWIQFFVSMIPVKYYDGIAMYPNYDYIHESINQEIELHLLVQPKVDDLPINFDTIEKAYNELDVVRKTFASVYLTNKTTYEEIQKKRKEYQEEIKNGK